MNKESHSPFIELRHITKVYGNGPLRQSHIRALSDICIEINKGELLAFIGPNGAGKSTCMKIIAGIVHPTSGYVRIIGKSEISFKNRMGYLPEQIPIPKQMTPYHFLNMMGRLNGLHGSALADRIEEVLLQLHMDEWKNERMKNFSKGMLQKIGFAQAILHKPVLLLLDEPSDGLDPKGKKEIRDFLKSYRDFGNTVLLNSHHLAELEMLADRLILINKGIIIKEGTFHDFTLQEECIVISICGTLPEYVANQLKIYGLSKSNGYTSIDIHTQDHLPKILELLSANRIAPSSIITKRKTLEDAYLAITEGDNRL